MLDDPEWWAAVLDGGCVAGGAVEKHGWIEGSVLVAYWDGGDVGDGAGAVDCFGKGGVSAVEETGAFFGETDKDLGAVGVWVGVSCHGEDAEVVGEGGFFEVDHVARAS